MVRVMAGRFRVQKWRRPYHRGEDLRQPVRTPRWKLLSAAAAPHAALNALECARGAIEV
jgi:hypothetical protein